MANVKITELTAATALAGTDVLPIVDVGADATKKVSVSDLLRNLPDGTASAPALAFADDQNTGVLSPAANELAFATSGTQRLVIDSSGNVGIGTTSPSNNLDILSTTSGATVSARVGSTAASGVNNANLIINNGGTGNATLRFDYESSTNRASIGVPQSTQALFFTTAGSERMRIDSSGALAFNGSGLIKNQAATSLTMLSGGNASNSGANILLYGQSASPANTTIFRASASESMRIDSSSRVGIGTSSPDQKLHIVGNYKGVNASGQGVQIVNTATPYIQSLGTSTINDLMVSSKTFRVETGTSYSTSERLRIDSSGNVGIGTTSPAERLHVYHPTGNVNAVIESGDANAYLSFKDSSTSSTSHVYLGAAGNDMQFATGTVERMRIDSSGNVGIGTTSAGAVVSGMPTLHLASATAGRSGAIRWKNTGETNKAAAYWFGTEFQIGTETSHPLKFTTADTERMRITSAGRMYLHGSPNLFISNTASAGTSQVMIAAGHSATDIESSTLSFRVYNNGNVQNTNNSYGQISDVKLKENIVSANSQWDDIKAVQVRNFNFKEETNNPTHTQIGVVAQEIETVSPGLVYETPDRDAEGEDLGTVTKSVNYSVLYMKAVKALQEAMGRIETLEAKVAVLEAQ